MDQPWHESLSCFDTTALMRLPGPWADEYVLSANNSHFGIVYGNWSAASAFKMTICELLNEMTNFSQEAFFLDTTDLAVVELLSPLKEVKNSTSGA